jgi:hypothetical protein
VFIVNGREYSMAEMARLEAMREPRYYCGLDLGQSQDYTALAIIEKAGQLEAATFSVRYLKRWALQTRYTAIVEDVIELMDKLPPTKHTRPLLAVDQTGVGAGVVDLFRKAKPPGWSLEAVHITSGYEVHYKNQVRYVPKRLLVSEVAIKLEQGRLRFAPWLPEAETLKAELGNFRCSISANGHDSYGAGPSGDDWRQGAHDDLVLSVALALSGERIPSRQLIRL